MKTDSEILKTIRYFSFFSYPPTLGEIYVFLGKKTSQERLKTEIRKLIQAKKIKSFSDNPERYRVGEYSIRNKNKELSIKNYLVRKKTAEKKIKKVGFYIKLLSFFPQIKLVGLSGSVAMMNAVKEDDIDLFVITAKNRMFTGRMIAIALAELLRIRRERGKKNRRYGISDGKKVKDKVCLNLFFDEGQMTVPKFKQTEYVGHEVLQMKPRFNKNSAYEKFIMANKWVFKIFPNAQDYLGLLADSHGYKRYQRKFVRNLWKSSYISKILEAIFKKIQLRLINKHKTKELIRKGQLWFFPEDFEDKLNNR